MFKYLATVSDLFSPPGIELQVGRRKSVDLQNSADITAGNPACNSMVYQSYVT